MLASLVANLNFILSYALKPAVHNFQVSTLEVACGLLRRYIIAVLYMPAFKPLQNPQHKFINILYIHTVIHCGGKNDN